QRGVFGKSKGRTDIGRSTDGKDLASEIPGSTGHRKIREIFHRQKRSPEMDRRSRYSLGETLEPAGGNDEKSSYDDADGKQRRLVCEFPTGGIHRQRTFLQARWAGRLPINRLPADAEFTDGRANAEP